MIRDLLKWVVPGLVTVLAGSTLSLAMTSTNIANDVAAQSTATLQRAGFDWAELSYAMRDLTLSGTTTDQRNVEAATKRLALVPGVRSVVANVTLAPIASPYRLAASLANGKIALSGGVPDQTTRQLLLTSAGIDQGDLELRSGMPERRIWVAGAQFAIDQLRYLDQGQSSISGLKVDISGRARSERDFRDLLIVLRAGPPAGVTLGDVQITPALVSPYQWSASSDGKRIEVSGFVPDQSLVERYRSAETGGLAVATGLAMGSGEPEGFADISQMLIEELSRLEYGTARLVDGQFTLTGAPATLEIAQAVTEQVLSAGGTAALEPPRVDDYWVSATLQPGGALVFDGYAPDAATRDDLQLRQGANTQWLKLARGAPERYQSAMDFGLTALQRFSEGRFTLRKNVLSLNGTARSGEDYLALLAILSEEAPQGFVLGSSEILAPAASEYSWTAVKAASGAITLLGMVPNPETKATLLSATGSTTNQTLSYASGEPRNFLASAQTGLTLLGWLNEGRVVFDGTGWTVTGSAKSTVDKGAIEADFASRKLAGAGWSMAIAAPAPILPTVDPYTWSATRTEQGITLAGSVPDLNLKQSLATMAGDELSDSSQLAAGAPEGFAAAATAALDAIVGLDDGGARFDGSTWTLTGRAPSGAVRDAMRMALDKATDTSAWTIGIDVPDPAPAKPYTWSAIKASDGTVTLTGLVPADELKRFLAVRVGDQLADQTTIDPAAPSGFALDVLAAVDALSNVTDGLADFDGGQWRIDGNLIDSGSAATVDKVLATAATPASAWNLTLLAPEPEPEPAVSAEPGSVPEPEPAAPTVAEPDVVAPVVEAPVVAAPVVEEPVVEAPTPPVVDADYAFSASRTEDGAVILSGQVPTDAALQQLAAIADGDTAAVSIAAGAPPTFLGSADIGLHALLQLQPGQLDFADGAWRLRGMAPDAAGRDAVLAAIAADTANNWSVAFDVPIAEVAQPVAAPPPAASSAAKVDISACVGPIADFSGRNAILFQSGAALIATESETALDELVTILADCPDAVIHVEGYTDADGDARANLALSVARAETVVRALVDRGINPQRLYAVGYGETNPIADNATSAGKRQNRRIVVTVSDEHF
jgi:outer membrane protein OmpA-like peptidoglycan-associated protein